MGFSDWSTGKKIALILIIIIGIVCVVGIVNYFISGYSSNSNTLTVAQGDYKVKIETENGWAYYITTDGQYSQDEGSGPQTIDLGNIKESSSITVNQKGSGTTKVSILDSKNKTIDERSSSVDYGSIYILLKTQ